MAIANESFAQLFDTNKHQALAPHLLRVHFAQGDVAIHQGATSPGLWFIQSGGCDVTTQAPDLKGDGAKLAPLKAGDVFAEVACIDNSQCTATVTANTKTTCLMLPSKVLAALAITEPKLGNAFTAAIAQLAAQRIRRIVERIKAEAADHTVRLSHAIAKRSPERLSSIEAHIGEGNFHRLPEFTKVSDAALATLQKHVPAYRYSKGSLIFEAKAPENHAWLVLRGAMQTYFLHDGGQHKLSVIGPSRFAGLVSFTDGLPRPSHAFAREDTVALRFDHDAMQRLAQHDASLSHALTSEMQMALIRNFRPFLMHLLQAKAIAQFI